MKKMLFFLLLPCLQGFAHPGIGIVKDSKGTIYYSDLSQVWRITKGKKSIVVPNVHSHELYLDVQDNLYGENETYDDKTGRYTHYLWILKTNGVLDTIISPREAYQFIDYSLTRDSRGNEYYIKQFIKRPDTAHIYKKLADGREVVFARGNFRGVSWLHPQKDGSVLFVQQNNVYRANASGTVKLLAKGIGSSVPSFAFSRGHTTVYGVWQDNNGNVYVAVFSDQVVRKISPQGRVTDYYRCKGAWAPTQGVFDDSGVLWLLQSSDKNEVGVVHVVPGK